MRIECKYGNEIFWIMIARNTEGIIEMFYFDKLISLSFKRPIRYYPQDPNMVQKIRMSRNRINPHLLKLLEIPADELEEFKSCTTEEQMKLLAKRDLIKNKITIVKEE